jgi:hypothetical protein
MRTGIAIVALAWLTACSRRHDLFGIIAPKELAADEKRTIEIAAQFVSTNRNWPGGDFERPKHTPNGGWSVLVWRHPRSGNDNMLVSIDGTGHVTDSHAGQ